MTWEQILFWILVIILLFILFKINIIIFWVVLIVAIIYLVVKWFGSRNEQYQPMNMPAPIYAMEDCRTVNECSIPSMISEYCVHKRLQEGCELDSAIAQCFPPTPTSSACATNYRW